MGGHSILAPSAAHRWINCTPSARLEEGLESISVYSEEGSVAHELAEKILNGSSLAKIRKNPYYSKEMAAEVKKYVDYLREKEAKIQPFSLEVEMKLDLSFLAPGQIGTADSIMVSGDGKELHVTDLKFGMGVKVFADNNPQQMLYAAGALYLAELLYDIETVVICIHQPRLDHISEWTISAEDLKKWVSEVAIPAAAKAYAGEGDLVAGAHCKFCKVKGKCRALADKAMEISEHDFKDPAILSPAEIGKILETLPVFEDWVSAIKDHAKSELLARREIPGFKLVEGRANRVITDALALQEHFKANGYTPDYYLDVKMKGLTDMEKRFGNKVFADLAAPFITKPKGAPTIAPASDPRPEYDETIFEAQDGLEL